jgi:hypothetical protein
MTYYAVSSKAKILISVLAVVALTAVSCRSSIQVQSGSKSDSIRENQLHSTDGLRGSRWLAVSSSGTVNGGGSGSGDGTGTISLTGTATNTTASGSGNGIGQGSSFASTGNEVIQGGGGGGGSAGGNAAAAPINGVANANGFGSTYGSGSGTAAFVIAEVEELRLVVFVEEAVDSKDNKNNKSNKNKNKNSKNEVQEPVYETVMVEKTAVIGGFGGGFAVSDSGGKGNVTGDDTGTAAAFGQGASSGGGQGSGFQRNSNSGAGGSGSGVVDSSAGGTGTVGDGAGGGGAVTFDGNSQSSSGGGSGGQFGFNTNYFFVPAVITAASAP